MDNRLHCFNKLEELFSLYDKVRQSVILLENFNEEQKMYIAPINQLRCLRVFNKSHISAPLHNITARVETYGRMAKNHITTLLK